MARITDNLIRTHKRPKAGQIFAWDDLVAGFGVRFTPTSSAYVVQWKDSTGAKRRKNLKRTTFCSAEEARNLARAHLSSATVSRSQGADVPLRMAMRNWYERNLVRRAWRPRYAHKVDRIISLYVEGEQSSKVNLSPTAQRAIEALGRKHVAAVTRSDVTAVHDNIAPGTAEQFMAIVSSAYGDFYEREWITSNPARNRLRLIPGGRPVRHRTPSEREFVELWRAFEKENDPAAAAFQLLAFTGCRRREITSLQHEEVNLEEGTITLPAERRKTGRRDPEPFVINLHTRAIELIRRQPVLEGSPFVFWGRRDRKPFDFTSGMIERIRDSVSVRDWRLHDVRRFVRSGMGKLGISQAVAEQCLGHLAKPGLVKVYDGHNYQAEKRDAWQRWGDHLAGIIG